MKTIQVVTHCNAIGFDYYASLLTYQLSSFFLYPPNHCKLKITIFYSSKDPHTSKVLDFFVGLGNLNIETIDMPLGELGRRAIGRNIVAKKTTADIVWFTDVDYVFRECLDSVALTNWEPKYPLIFPSTILIHKDFDIGIDYIKRVRNKIRIEDVNPNDFIVEKIPFPIGGVQIISGSVIRKDGYCESSPKYQKSTDGIFARCRCDIEFREKYIGRWKRTNIPNVYRLRHPVKNIKRALKRVRGRRLEGVLRKDHSASFYNKNVE
jgi:hypothetical protein